MKVTEGQISHDVRQYIKLVTFSEKKDFCIISDTKRYSRDVCECVNFIIIRHANDCYYNLNSLHLVGK